MPWPHSASKPAPQQTHHFGTKAIYIDKIREYTRWVPTLRFRRFRLGAGAIVRLFCCHCNNHFAKRRTVVLLRLREVMVREENDPVARGAHDAASDTKG